MCLNLDAMKRGDIPEYIPYMKKRSLREDAVAASLREGTVALNSRKTMYA